MVAMKTMDRVLYWLPRIVCMLAILFVSMFAADAFEPGKSLGQQFGDFFMHLIPSFVLLAFLVIAWKWELVGGAIFILAGVVMTPFIFFLNYNRNHFSVGQSLGVILMITFPFIVAGGLFLVSYFRRKKILRA
jgi:hypothetical protein